MKAKAIPQREAARVVAKYAHRLCKLEPDGCWVIPGLALMPSGYLLLATGGELGRMRTTAHRIWYAAKRGGLGVAGELDHLCRNRACVNPAHLELVNHRTNVLRGQAPPANKARQSRCKRGHPLGGSNLHIRKNGSRRCRACTHELSARQNERIPRSRSLFCPRGHRRTRSNVRCRGYDGAMYCRDCRVEADRLKYLRKKAKAARPGARRAPTESPRARCASGGRSPS